MLKETIHRVVAQILGCGDGGPHFESPLHHALVTCTMGRLIQHPKFKRACTNENDNSVVFLECDEDLAR